MNRSALVLAVTCLFAGAVLGHFVPPMLDGTRGLGVAQAVPAATVPAAPDLHGLGYLPHLQVFDIVSYRTEGPMGRVVAVRFKVRNTGDRTVKRLDVALSFRDATNAVVRRGSVTPFRVGAPPLPFGRTSLQVLNPGHLFEMESTQYFGFENVPDTWQAGNVTAEITRIDTD